MPLRIAGLPTETDPWRGKLRKCQPFPNEPGNVAIAQYGAFVDRELGRVDEFDQAKAGGEADD